MCKCGGCAESALRWDVAGLAGKIEGIWQSRTRYMKKKKERESIPKTSGEEKVFHHRGT